MPSRSPDGLIHAAFDTTLVTAEGGGGGRTIRGVAVPWDRWGRVSDGAWVRFAPGSLDPSARPVVAIGHDSARPIGRVSSNTSDDAGMVTSVRVSRVRDGDEALVLAQDGVLGMFSVGVDPTEWHTEPAPDGTDGMVVTAGDWQHLALLPFGAFADALVTDVAASAPTQGATPMPDFTGQFTGTIDDTAPPADQEPPAQASQQPVAAAAPPAPVQAAAPVPQPGPQPVPVNPAGPSPAAGPFNIGRLARIIAEGNQRGLRAGDVQARIQAALTNVTTANVPSPPAYRTELVGLIDHGAPLASRLEQRPLPESGMEILYPEWTAFPDSTTKQAGEKTPIASGDVSWAWRTNPVETFAQGNDLSLQAVQRSSPSAMDAYLRAAAVDASKKWDIYLANKLIAAAGTGATAGTTFLETVAALMGELDPASTPPGRLWLAMSYAEALPLITVKSADGPAYFNMNLSLGEFLPDSPDVAGIDAFVDPYLPCRYLMGVSSGAAVYGGPPTTDIRVVDVSLLGVDVGVYFFGSSAVEYPGAFSYVANPVGP